MNTYYITDKNYANSSSYLNFLNNNQSRGFLKVRAFAANEAIPIKGVNIVVSKIIDDAKVIFFEGTTNESGIVEKIALPAPQLKQESLEAPLKMIYDIEASYNNITSYYKVNIYENIYVVQAINITPKMNMGDL